VRTTPGHDPLAAAIPTALAGRRLAVAESFTGGALSQRLVAVPGSAEWFRGGVVAYDEEVKYDLLDVRRGPVISREAAEQMARGVAARLGAPVGLSTTGAAGPEPAEGQPVGTVWVGWVVDGAADAVQLQLDGTVEEICVQGTDRALAALLAALAPVTRDRQVVG
jgi:PncC family amidohydrolase